MSEYPKFLPKLDAEGKETDEGAIVVQNADEEAAALTRGHVTRKSVRPARAPDAAGNPPPAFLEFPKYVYRGEDGERKSRLVKDADAEAAAAADGFAPLEPPADGDVHGGTVSEKAPQPEGEQKPKAPKTPRKPKAPK